MDREKRNRIIWGIWIVCAIILSVSFSAWSCNYFQKNYTKPVCIKLSEEFRNKMDAKIEKRFPGFVPIDSWDDCASSEKAAARTFKNFESGEYEYGEIVQLIVKMDESITIRHKERGFLGFTDL